MTSTLTLTHSTNTHWSPTIRTSPVLINRPEFQDPERFTSNTRTEQVMQTELLAQGLERRISASPPLTCTENGVVSWVMKLDNYGQHKKDIHHVSHQGPYSKTECPSCFSQHEPVPPDVNTATKTHSSSLSAKPRASHHEGPLRSLLVKSTDDLLSTNEQVKEDSASCSHLVSSFFLIGVSFSGLLARRDEAT